MNKRPAASEKIRCHSCRLVFVVNLAKEKDAPEDQKVEMSRPCPYCGEANRFIVEKSMVPIDVDTVYRGVIQGTKP